MSFQITGTLYHLEPEQQVSTSFRKRSFVVRFEENPSYPQLIPLECTQQRCELLDGFSVGDLVEVHFNLKGREWLSPKGEKKYFLTLDTWKIRRPDAGGDQTHAAIPVAFPTEQDMSEYAADDLPF